MQISPIFSSGNVALVMRYFFNHIAEDFRQTIQCSLCSGNVSAVEMGVSDDTVSRSNLDWFTGKLVVYGQWQILWDLTKWNPWQLARICRSELHWHWRVIMMTPSRTILQM